MSPLPAPGLLPATTLLPGSPTPPPPPGGSGGVGGTVVAPRPVYGPGLPDLRTLAAWHYQQLAPIAGDDSLHGYPWAHYCAALWGPVEDFAFLISDQPDGTPGYALAMMVDTCPASMLRWLGQQVGVTIRAGTDEQTARTMIRETRGWKRGKIPAMVAEVKATLTGTKHVEIVERYTGNAHMVRVITRSTETPDPTATLAAARNKGHKRIGIIVDLLVIDGQTWNEAQVNDPTRTWNQLGVDEPTKTWLTTRTTDVEV